jgi:hypothetical protein
MFIGRQVSAFQKNLLIPSSVSLFYTTNGGSLFKLYWRSSQQCILVKVVLWDIMLHGLLHSNKVFLNLVSWRRSKQMQNWTISHLTLTLSYNAPHYAVFYILSYLPFITNQSPWNMILPEKQGLRSRSLVNLILFIIHFCITITSRSTISKWFFPFGICTKTF